LLQRFILH